MGGQSTNETLHKQPARLVAALAKSNESRLRLSLIPLFLEHPEFALHVRTAAKNATHLLALRFNAITLPQSGWVKNADNPYHCQITFHENEVCVPQRTSKKTCELWQNLTRQK